jgi:malate dehydrogenase
VLKAAKGAKGLVEPSYVYLPGVPGGKEIAEKTGVDFFSVPIELGVSQFRTLHTPRPSSSCS